jgi:DNA-binding transcriptional ArsR family regulator
MELAEVHIVEDTERAAALLEPTRLRLLGELAQPASAIELARRTGLPRQRIGHHLRVLEREGWVELVEERRKRNTTERVLRACARSLVVSPAVLGPTACTPEVLKDRYSWGYLVAVAARTIRDLATLRGRADHAKKKLPTLTIDTEVRFASARNQAAFAAELTQTIGDLCVKYNDQQASNGRTFRVLGGVYPKITKTEEESEEVNSDEGDGDDARG